MAITERLVRDHGFTVEADRPDAARVDGPFTGRGPSDRLLLEELETLPPMHPFGS